MATERIFISADVPMVPEIEEAIADIKKASNVRPVPKEQMHITLKFLGDTDAASIPILCSELKDRLSSFSGFGLAMKGMGVFPDIRNPRVVWIGFEDPEELIKLSDAVTEAVSSLKLRCDKKKFSPHVTLGRINGKTDLSAILEKYREKEFCRFRCTSVNVMRSELTPKGAKHSVVCRIELS